MTDVTRNPVLQAALDAYAAGLCPIRVRCDGTKRPLGEWRKYQHERPDQADLIPWFRDAEGLGLVCGQISDRLMMIEFEARAMGLLDSFPEALGKLGLWETFEAWLFGYAERTPTGGMHILVHVGGEGPLPGNEKIASDSEGLVLIETRGEGGFVVVAPSHGGTHPSGEPYELKFGGFDTIEWTTPELFGRMLAALGKLDQTPPREAPGWTSPPPSPRSNGEWFEEEKALLEPLESILLRHGWAPTGTQDSYGRHWVRPGKEPREGHSATISHAAERLWVHSTSTPLPTDTSLDKLDVHLILDLGVVGRPTLEDRVDCMVAYHKSRRPATPPGRRDDDDTGPAGTVPGPSLNLPDEFWQARPYLAHIRQAAEASRVNPSALWCAVKVFYAASIHPSIQLPENGTLDYIGVNVGSSGAGKSKAMGAALEIMPQPLPDRVQLAVPGGSGEGMVEHYLQRLDGAQVVALDGVGFYIDEGKWLADVNSRAGNVTVQTMKSGWSGLMTGTTAATADRKRILQPRAVRMSVLISIQPRVAALFLRQDLEEGGFPQRIAWSWAHPDSLPERRPEHPGRLSVPIWTPEHWGTHYDPYSPRRMRYEPELAQLVDDEQVAGLMGERSDREHDLLATLKGAAILALMDNRQTITMADWALAQLDWETGRRIRQHILDTQKQGVLDQDEAAGYSSARREEAKARAHLESAIQSLATKVRYHDGPLTVREAKDHLRHFSRRHGVHHQEVITVALQRGLIARAEGGLTPAPPEGGPGVCPPWLSG